MSRLASIRRLLDQVVELAMTPDERRERDLAQRLACLSLDQRRRYDEHLAAMRCNSYEEMLAGIEDSKSLDQDIWRALYGDTLITVDDDEQSAADKYFKLKEHLR